MDKNIFIPKRKNYIEQGEIFFWTASINAWHPLLQEDEFKKIIVDSLDYLTNKGKIDVFAFVIMPTHIHLIWRTKELRPGSCLHEPAFSNESHFIDRTEEIFTFL